MPATTAALVLVRILVGRGADKPFATRKGAENLAARERAFLVKIGMDLPVEVFEAPGGFLVAYVHTLTAAEAERETARGAAYDVRPVSA